MVKKTLLIALYTLFAAAESDLKLVTESDTVLYFENLSSSSVIGYGFSIENNELAIKINGTTIDEEGNQDEDKKTDYTVIPLTIVEFTESSPSTNTTSFPSGDWRFETEEVEDGIWTIDSIFTSEGNQIVDFRCLIADRKVEYEGFKIIPEMISMEWTINQFPSKLQDSTIAINTLLISEAKENAVVGFKGEVDRKDNLGTVVVDRIGSADGDKQDVVLFVPYISNPPREEAIDSTAFTVAQDAKIESYAPGLENAGGKNDLVFRQELFLNIEMLSDEDHDDDNDDSNGSFTISALGFGELIAFVGLIAFYLA